MTDFDTGDIVNAANESFCVGSGVCGAIFEVASYAKLQMHVVRSVNERLGL